MFTVLMVLAVFITTWGVLSFVALLTRAFMLFCNKDVNSVKVKYFYNIATITLGLSYIIWYCN
jgi:hypothetical protein